MRILFVLKKNETYGFTSYCRRSSGLWNSTRFIVESLVERGVDAGIVEVIDNNCIDKYVRALRPDIVVIEALWVVPSKFEVLKRLHPHVQWFIHLHSDMPFLALEGIATEWIRAYANDEIGLIANSPGSYASLRCFLDEESITMLPNVYLSEFFEPKAFETDKEHIDVGCFGAVRPLKNQLFQALAAIRFAKEIGNPLRFHINASRIETGGQPVLKNLRALFEGEPHAELIEQHWHEPEEFLELLNDSIDLGMQVSLTETFNVVSADYVTAGVPMVVSKEVAWASSWNKALDNDVDDVVKKMYRVLGNRKLITWNQRLLAGYSARAQRMWSAFVEALE